MNCRCLTERDVGLAALTLGGNTTEGVFFVDAVGPSLEKVVCEWRVCDILGRVRAGWIKEVRVKCEGYLRNLMGSALYSAPLSTT